ncbi:MAG: rubrerythrin [Clostridiales bacterium]|nr:rubrerythrin [Clostridiales bacterium]MDY4173461.1 ferritin family protein [Evtepia sp.]
METNQNGKYCVRLDLPYPPVQPETHRKDYAYAMLSNVGSDASEISTVSLHFYNSTILTPQHETFAHCFHEISIVEMHHLNIFASMAHQMGLDPRLWAPHNGRNRYWTPGFLHYPQQLLPLLHNAIQSETAAIRKYSRQAELIQDANIVANLRRIIQDEENHIQIFRTMLTEVAGS